jgi:hypothetical protein
LRVSISKEHCTDDLGDSLGNCARTGGIPAPEWSTHEPRA